jgi:hypothetical protein
MNTSELSKQPVLVTANSKTCTTKRCARCGETKLADQFYKSNQVSDGLNSYCSTCSAEVAMEYLRRKKLHDAGEDCDCGTCVRRANEKLGIKRCPRCKASKPYSDFAKSSGAKDGLQTYCRKCGSELSREQAEKRKLVVHGATCGCRTCVAGEKCCTQCGITKSISEFGENLTAADGLQCACKRCSRFIMKLSRYRIDESQFTEMLRIQDSKCAVCEVVISEETALVDHDHRCCPGTRACGECNRGLLCRKCNSASGFLGDDPGNALSLANYLMRSENLLQLTQEGI